MELPKLPMAGRNASSWQICLSILTDRWKSGLAPNPLIDSALLTLRYDTKSNFEVCHGQRGSKLHLTFLKVSHMNLAYPKTYSLVLKCLKSAQG